MAIATASREEKFRWLYRPLDWALSVGMFSLVGTYSLATSGWHLGYAIAWQAGACVVMTGFVMAAMFRMSRAAGKL